MGAVTERRLRRALGCVLAAAAIALATGCGSSHSSGGSGGGSSSAQHITLTMVDNDTASEGPLNTITQSLVKAFEKSHPNVTIQRSTKSFNDYEAATRLEATGPNPPDIIQGNIGLSLDGPLVRAGALLSLERYDRKYGWSKRFGAAGMQQFRFTADGSRWGSGNLYGVSSKAELVWVYYNKAKLHKLGLGVPDTLPKFEQALAKAKQAGEIPIMFGNTDQWPASHVYSVIQNALAPAAAIRSWALGQDGANFDTPADLEAAQKLAAWSKAGYFTPGFEGLSYDTSVAKFAKGQGVFMITGTWSNQPFVQGLRSNVGAFLLRTASGAIPAVTGGLADPWHISSRSKYPDVAAEFINSMVDAEGAKVYAHLDALPSGPVPLNLFPAGSLSPLAAQALAQAVKADAMVPYLGFPTPTIGPDTLFPDTQELMGGKMSPQDYVKQVQAAWVSGR